MEVLDRPFKGDQIVLFEEIEYALQAFFQVFILLLQFLDDLVLLLLSLRLY
jgi:hypothetical protein